MGAHLNMPNTPTTAGQLERAAKNFEVRAALASSQSLRDEAAAIARACREAAKDVARLDRLDARVKGAGFWEDVVLAHDYEDGVWLARIERGAWHGRALGMAAPLPDLRAAIDAALPVPNAEVARADA